MKVIERKMLQAVKLGKCTDLGNTRITSSGNRRRIYLFNNLIAEFDFADTVEANPEIGVPEIVGSLYVYTSYQSATTKSRLNAILREYANTSIHQSDYVWYYADNTYTGNGRTFWGITK